MDSRKTILGELALAKQLPPGTLHFLVPKTPSPPGGTYNPMPRLIVITKGSKSALLPTAKGPRNLLLQTGDMLCCPSGSWEKHDWRGYYKMLCIVPRQDFLRVSTYEHRSMTDTGHPPSVFIHTGLPYSETMRATTHALNSASKIKNPEIVHSLAMALICLAEEECLREVKNDKRRPELLYNQMCNWVASSYQEEIGREAVAKVFNISQNYVSQLFKKHGGVSFQDYLAGCRMAHARKLLKESNLTVYQIADQCGYRNCVHFVRKFRQLNGKPPGHFRDATM
jgi:AraC-like DNA-binding protein